MCRLGKCSHCGGAHEISMQKYIVTVELSESKGFIVEADHFTIEACGAVTFWKVIIRGELSELVLAVGPGHWAQVEKQVEAG